MVNLADKFRNSEFRYLFNFNNELAVGRSALYIYNIIITVTNAIISGVMYTAFLTVNGIDIVRVSIITFIPFIAWAFSVFSPMIYSRIKKRRGVLIFNTTFYYTCIILATTVMPGFVSDPAARTVWFAVFLLAGNISNALFSSGAVAWHIHFISDERSRTGYFAKTNVAVTVVSTVVSISAALSADALAGSPKQAFIINGMRYTAYALALFSTLYLWLRPKAEYPYPEVKKKLKLFDVLREPASDKAFLYTALIFFVYNFIANVNAGSWHYYIMNTLGYKYTAMYTGSIAYSLAYIFLIAKWHGAVKKYDYLKVYLVTVFASALLEIPMGLTRPGTVYIYITTLALQGINLVGTSFINSNLFYINLPAGKTDTCNVFWNLGTNIFALLGGISGTWFISFTERTGPYNINLDFLFLHINNYTLYGSQLLVFIKFLLFMLFGIFIIKSTRRIKATKEPKGKAV